MPEGLRHSIAFVSSLVTMTLNLDQVKHVTTSSHMHYIVEYELFQILFHTPAVVVGRCPTRPAAISLEFLSGLAAVPPSRLAPGASRQPLTSNSDTCVCFHRPTAFISPTPTVHPSAVRKHHYRHHHHHCRAVLHVDSFIRLPYVIPFPIK